MSEPTPGRSPSPAVTAVERLTRLDLGGHFEIDAWTTGYLYGIRDDFHDGYPSRVLTLVDEEGDAHEKEFTDSDPAGYPKTMSTLVVDLDALASRYPVESAPGRTGAS